MTKYCISMYIFVCIRMCVTVLVKFAQNTYVCLLVYHHDDVGSCTFYNLYSFLKMCACVCVHVRLCVSACRRYDM